MREWFKKQWHIIEGNAKFRLVEYIGGLAIVAGGYLVHKLPHTPDWLPYGVVFILAVFCFVWLGSRASQSVEQVIHAPLAQPSAPESLRERLFALSKNIKEFLKSYGDEPEWNFAAVDKSEGLAKFNNDNQERITRSTKIKHGFYFRFYSDVLNIIHECGERGITDEELFNALGGKLEEDWEIRKIADKLALLAAKIEE